LFSLLLSHQNRATFFVGLRWFCSYTTTSLLSQRSAKAKAVKGVKADTFLAIKLSGTTLNHSYEDLEKKAPASIEKNIGLQAFFRK